MVCMEGFTLDPGSRGEEDREREREKERLRIRLSTTKRKNPCFVDVAYREVSAEVSRVKGYYKFHLLFSVRAYHATPCGTGTFSVQK